MAKKSWSELSALQQQAILVAGALEVVMTVAALRDLSGRPRGDVRGPKAAWALAMAVQPIGPVAYFTVGRR